MRQFGHAAGLGRNAQPPLLREPCLYKTTNCLRKAVSLLAVTSIYCLESFVTCLYRYLCSISTFHTAGRLTRSPRFPFSHLLRSSSNPLDFNDSQLSHND
jgi:hypothetical protein